MIDPIACVLFTLLGYSIAVCRAAASVDGSGEADETPQSGSARRATARSSEAGDAQ